MNNGVKVFFIIMIIKFYYQSRDIRLAWLEKNKRKDHKFISYQLIFLIKLIKLIFVDKKIILLKLLDFFLILERII